MADLLTLMLDPHYSIERQILMPRTAANVGGGGQALRRPYARPVYQFLLSDRQRVQADAEALYGFAMEHQGDSPFWWNGGIWGAPTTPLLVAIGNGVTTAFWLPNRYLTDAPMVYIGAVLADPQPMVDLASGHLVFAAPVALDALITAAYACRYRVIFWFEREALLSLQYFARQLFSAEGIALRERLDPATEVTQMLYTATWELDATALLSPLYTTSFSH